MFVRSSNVRSRSILPTSLRRFVCASWVIAKMKSEIPYEARSAFITFRYRMPSTPTWTLSRVMQTWAGMSIARSLSEWR
jgi:hypothetical protein